MFKSELLSPSQLLSQPTAFGGWEAIARLAEGRIFTLFVARPFRATEALPPCYVIKTLRPGIQQSLGRMLLRREVEVSCAVGHPRIVSVLAWQLEEPIPYTVMPYLEGQSLKHRLECRPLSLPAALGIARQIAEALTALEAAGWTHGDLKPSNVHIGKAGQVTLIDLGFARRIGVENDRHRYLACTPLYMAPELLRSRTAGDIRSDVYSLGVIIYEMLAGVPPFRLEGPADLPGVCGGKEVPPLRACRPDVPSTVERFVRRLLARDPLRRPPQAREVLEELIDLETQVLCRLGKSLLCLETGNFTPGDPTAAEVVNKLKLRSQLPAKP